ncbi:MAG TPA: BTAD domain-containing putative transcriptional regulator [Gaiellaceae bacterium]|nr:BTAD domain-containing putative transcriptional regulator [Gaiellaceae bacterium]
MEVRILGSLEVRDGDRLIDLGSGRQRALLVLLALQAGEAVGTEGLVDALWGPSPPPSAAKALRNLVSQLRQTLGSDAIATQPSAYRLRISQDDLDARVFEREASAGRTLLDEDPARASAILREALSLWRGGALADFAYEEFAQVEIARLEELRLGAIEDRVEADLALGAAADLVPELEALVASHPLRERLRGQLMHALYRSGRQADALAAYRQGRALLHDELGLEPSVALRDLESAILNQDPALDGPTRSRRLPSGRRRRVVVVASVAVLIVLGSIGVLASLVRGEEAPTVVPNSLVQIDARTNQIVDVVAVGRNPGDVAVVGPYVFVSSEDDATLTRVEVASGEVTTTGAGGADTGLAPAGDRFVWVASRSQARVTRVDAENLLPVDFVRIPRDLNFAFVALGGGSLWVSHYPSSAVVRYRLHTLALERRYPFSYAETPVEIAYGYGAAWVGLGGSSALLRIDASSGRSKELSVGAPPSETAVGFGSIWTANFTLDEVKRVDVLSESVRAIIEVGNVPFGVATSADAVWVSNQCDGTVSRIDPESDDVVATVETGYFPKWLAAGGGYVWVGIGAEVFSGATCD